MGSPTLQTELFLSHGQISWVGLLATAQLFLLGSLDRFWPALLCVRPAFLRGDPITSLRQASCHGHAVTGCLCAPWGCGPS